MDYIYGVALHQDEVRRSRQANVTSPDTIFEAVIIFE